MCYYLFHPAVTFLSDEVIIDNPNFNFKQVINEYIFDYILAWIANIYVVCLKFKYLKIPGILIDIKVIKMNDPKELTVHCEK